MHPADSQTISELQIITANVRMRGLLDYFDQTKTPGGRDALRHMILNPKKELGEVQAQQLFLKEIIRTLPDWQVDVARTYIADTESHYSSNIACPYHKNGLIRQIQSLRYAWRNPNEYYLIQRGIFASIRIIRELNGMLANLSAHMQPASMPTDIRDAADFLALPGFSRICVAQEQKMSAGDLLTWDHYLRFTHKEQFRKVLDAYYKLDACLAITRTAVQEKLVFPDFPAGQTTLDAVGLWHPLLRHAVPNDFRIGPDPSLCLLTGANTSGKTSFLKTCGIAVYLAHLGLPVPAKKLILPFFDRLFTSINLADNLELGHSHFYSEVMRIHTIAASLHAGETCFVVIDELFRGTNPEDAFHCSQTVIDGFLRKEKSHFIVSTHLSELIRHYQNSGKTRMQCFRTQITGNDFTRTFRIEDGVSMERIGQLLLNQSGIARLLD